MSLSSSDIIALLSLLAMCIPGLYFLYEVFQRWQFAYRRRQAYENGVGSGYELNPIPRGRRTFFNPDSVAEPNQSSLLEGGMMLLAARSTTSEIFIARSPQGEQYQRLHTHRGEESEARMELDTERLLD
ncbi:hypothetical protein K449DRAFT_399662 [Hypoxylon sp. EC38]|nr:hypothetical protein K449DRAFT_399662 [Hypoxylon sp. EC38]